MNQIWFDKALLDIFEDINILVKGDLLNPFFLLDSVITVVDEKSIKRAWLTDGIMIERGKIFLSEKTLYVFLESQENSQSLLLMKEIVYRLTRMRKLFVNRLKKSNNHEYHKYKEIMEEKINFANSKLEEHEKRVDRDAMNKITAQLSIIST